MQAQEIIKAYIKTIGGEKKINKIKTLQKKIEIKITNSSHVKMNALIMYKQPNLYNYSLSIDGVGEVESIKYDGAECIIKRNYNNEQITHKLEDQLLKVKKQEFYPFPILRLYQSKHTITLLSVDQSSDKNLYVIQLDDNNIKTQLFFDIDNKLLVMKKSVENNRTKTVKYENYNEFEGVMFPYKEIKTQEIDGKIVQEDINEIVQITINEKITINQFQ
tara:strand:- start:11 stop:667 length:657 start_codon:yes stop_codon:yes gene_type:complete